MRHYKFDLPSIVGIAVTKGDTIDKLEEIEVHTINYYVPVKDQVTVLVTPSSKVKDSIFSVLDKLGFKQYEWIDVNLIC